MIACSPYHRNRFQNCFRAIFFVFPVISCDFVRAYHFIKDLKPIQPPLGGHSTQPGSQRRGLYLGAPVKLPGCSTRGFRSQNWMVWCKETATDIRQWLFCWHWTWSDMEWRTYWVHLGQGLDSWVLRLAEVSGGGQTTACWLQLFCLDPSESQNGRPNPWWFLTILLSLQSLLSSLSVSVRLYTISR